MSFNSSNSIVSLLPFNSCVGYSTNLNVTEMKRYVRFSSSIIVRDLVLKSGHHQKACS